ncbi:MAG: hypothetical protein R6V03_04720 [Kiritimatiellia bacterium]
MKKLIITAVILVMSVPAAFAQAPSLIAPGTPDVYGMTFMEFQMRYKGSGEWKVINDTPTEVNLADFNPGVLAAAIGGGEIPAGSYDRFRSTVSMSIRLKATVASAGDGGIYYTDGGKVGVPDMDGVIRNGEGATVKFTAAFGLDVAAFRAAPPADWKEATIRPPETDTTHTVEGEDDIVIDPGDVIDEAMEVDVTNSVELWDFTGVGSQIVIFPAPPSINVGD